MKLSWKLMNLILKEELMSDVYSDRDGYLAFAKEEEDFKERYL